MADWSDRNVFVTGGTGFIGSWLVERLLDEGADVTVLVRDWPAMSKMTDDDDIVGNVNVVSGDVTGYDTVLRTLNEYRVDTVFHLAAQTIVGTGHASPRSTLETNIRGTWTVLDAVRAAEGVDRVVVASSDKAYDPDNSLPFEEDMELAADDPYGVSKSAADLVAQSFHETYGLPLTITRAANCYGGGDFNFSRLIPGTIRSVYRDERPIIRSDGTYVRDYLYVEDMVTAFLTLADQLDDDAVAGEAFNVGNDDPKTVLEVVEAVLDVMDSDLEPVIQDEAGGEVKEQTVAGDKIREMTGWTAEHTFREGLQKTVDWYTAYFDDTAAV